MQVFVDGTGWRRVGARLLSASLAGGMVAFAVLVASTLLGEF